MKTIVLISCTKRKLPHPAPAEFLYTGLLFKLSLAYARRLGPDAIYILSAEHGLVSLDQQLAPYDRTLSRMNRAEREVWGQKVLSQMTAASNPAADHFVILAGQAYTKPIIVGLPNHRLPLAGLSQGRRLQFLKRSLSGSPQDVS